jgi:UDP-N-acetylglucosamine--N-acetylmuramyl-(pentapeptide) pyrophosphoryl-undecaprenol N-acetylglucosamine transferase
MDLAYAVADVVISRAGALSVSEICVAKKPVILVPSPNVAEDHQTKNAKALSDKDAAILIPDSTARETLIDTALGLLFDIEKSAKLRKNIAAFARPNATSDIVNEIEKLLENESLDNRSATYKLSDSRSDSGPDRSTHLQTVSVRSR